MDYATDYYHYLWNYIKNNPVAIKDKKLMIIISVKILFPQISHRLIQFRKTA